MNHPAVKAVERPTVHTEEPDVQKFDGNQTVAERMTVDRKGIYMGILEEFNKKIVIVDGGMGSLLQEAGLMPGELPETWNIKHPEIVKGIHRRYLDAGADIITTNTFGANRLKYGSEGEYSLSAVIAAAIKNVKEAIAEAGHGYAALDLGPTGKLLKPMGELDFEDCVSIYAEVVKEGVKNGADLVLIETMSDSYELKAAVLAAKENSNLPVFATVIFDSKGKLLTGGTPKSTVALLEGLGIDAMGINCGLGPAQMLPIVEEIVKYASVPVIVNPNAGLPRSENGKTVYDIHPDEFAELMKPILNCGISAAGGCCGTTPDHIAALAEIAKDMEAPVIEEKNYTIVTSFASAVELSDDPVIIGERINPTGKSKFKQALRDHDIEYVLREGLKQQDTGAHILDVNVGLPEIDEPAMMREVVQELQAVTELPLQIDTSDPVAMEAALRVYNGKALVNSVNGKKEVMDSVFPLVKKYGGSIVALTIDESGIPATAEGRIQIAKNIIAEAAKYGIRKKDIVVDCLCMTISSDANGAITTLEAVKRARTELGVNTVLGVSNISFGLPAREIVNAAFFTMALQNGLTAAIINPNSDAMMRSYRSYRALAALDEHCSDYISAYANYVAPTAATKASAGAAAAAGANGASAGSGASGSGAASGSELENSLRMSVEKGLNKQAAEAAEKLLEEKDALSIINEIMVPALDKVGKGFEAGTVFLPQLLMSAEAAKAAFEVIKSRMSASGEEQAKKGRIIVATVKGDIHDIGKNIVKVLLENYSYDVIDLGKDVPPEKVVEEAIKQDVPLVGLSALMTTTVPAMEETIKQLHEKAPWVKVMVGGAVLTPEYAESIKADAYCSDAMASVNYAATVIG